MKFYTKNMKKKMYVSILFLELYGIYFSFIFITIALAFK